MTAFLHILHKNNKDVNLENLQKNRNIADAYVNHFLITDLSIPNKTLFSGFEQIFFYKNLTEIDTVSKFLKNMKYTKVFICDSNLVYDTIHYMDLNGIISPL